MDGGFGLRPGLTLDEMTACLQAFAYLRLPLTMPGYFGDYLVEWFDSDRPELSAKIRTKSSDELRQLHRYLFHVQSLLR